MEKLLDDQVTAQIREAFTELKEPVQVLYFGSKRECETCGTTRQLLEEIVNANDKLGLTVYDLEDDREVADKFNVHEAPGIVVASKDGPQVKDVGVHFSGIPAGHEFSTLITDILIVSKRDSGLNPKTREFLKKLDKPLLLQVFVTPT